MNNKTTAAFSDAIVSHGYGWLAVSMTRIDRSAIHDGPRMPNVEIWTPVFEDLNDKGSSELQPDTPNPSAGFNLAIFNGIRVSVLL